MTFGAILKFEEETNKKVKRPRFVLPDPEQLPQGPFPYAGDSNANSGTDDDDDPDPAAVYAKGQQGTVAGFPAGPANF